MLESSKESLKLEAMKRIVGVSASWELVLRSVLVTWAVDDAVLIFVCSQLIAKGKNSSELFPAVVKNVASKNIEVWRALEILHRYDSFRFPVTQHMDTHYITERTEQQEGWLLEAFSLIV